MYSYLNISPTQIYIRNAQDINLTYIQEPDSLIVRIFPVREEYNPIPVFVPQSGVDLKISTKSQTTAQTVTFVDSGETPVSEIEGMYPETAYIASTPDTSLSEFFSRPVQIYQFSWNVGDTYSSYLIDLNIYDKFLKNKRVSNRILNYAMLRARTHIKVVISGNGFYYGRMVAALLPMAKSDQMITATESADLIQLTQLPHVYINPTTSQGGEISVPYFNNAEYWNIAHDWDDAAVGIDNTMKLYIRQMNSLKHANGGTIPIRVNVYMWLSDVEVSNITSVNATFLVTQSGEEDVEANRDGMISGPASAVANAARALAAIPVIAPYARATDKAATLVASAARLVGLSRPPVTKVPERVSLVSGSSLALCTVPDLSRKLTVDDQAQLSIDPTLVGLSNKDPFNIASIAGRETYFASFNWLEAATGLIFAAPVQPVVWLESGTVPIGYHFPACAAAALPFRYWGGTIKYRFQIVCSNYHKGRIRVIWDPNYIAASVLSDAEYNVNLIKIIDIAETQDFTIEVGWGQSTPYVPHYRPGVDNYSEIWKSGGGTYAYKPWGNGVIGIDVENELTTPNSTVLNSVQVNVFISAGDDFRVAVPSADLLSFGFTPQSGMDDDQVDASNADELNRPIQENGIHMGSVDKFPDHTLLSYFGENVVSFRTLTKRFSRWRVERLLGDLNAVLYPMFPLHKGSVGPDTSVTYPVSGYNYVNMTYLNYIATCYAGWRGSIRYKFRPEHAFGTNYNSAKEVIMASRVAPRLVYGYKKTNSTLPAATSYPRIGVATELTEREGTSFYPAGIGGAAIETANHILEVEVPFQSRYKFSTARWKTWHTGPPPISPDLDHILLTTTVAYFPNVSVFVAAGEDFQCFWWVGLPKMFRATIVPT